MPFDDVVEVSNYVAALEHGLARIKDGFPLSNRLIRELHGVLMRRGRGSEKQPGEFRTSQNWLGGATPAQAVFVPLMLHVDGVLERPLLYLSLYFKQRREEYYARLERVRTEGDWEGWLAFFADGVIEVAENAVTAARRLADLVQHDRERVRGVGRGAPTALQIHEALQREPVTTIPRLVARTKLSVPGATAALQRLVALDLVREVTGRQRGRVYSYAPCVSLLSEGTEPLAR